MSQQPENEALTLQELREALLSEIEASQQAIGELSDEQLEQIAGGANGAFRTQVLNGLSKVGLIHPDRVEDVRANLYTLNTFGNNPSKSANTGAIIAGLKGQRFR